MKKPTFSRRDVLQGSSALALARVALPARVLAAAPPATAITPQLIEAAKKEGKVVYYTSIDLPIAERIAKAFEAKYPGIAVRVERTGAERVFQRIGQEYASRIHAVDVVNSSDAAHFIVWKREGILEPFVPEDVAKYYQDGRRTPTALFAGFRVGLERHRLQYRSGEGGRRAEKLRRSARSEMDGQDRQGASRLQRHHHDRDLSDHPRLGWEFLEKLAKQSVMQVQSAADPPKKLELGERAVQADGNEYNLLQIKEKKGPVEIVYPTEGTPIVVGPNGIFKAAPNPNAARLFQCYCFTPECQQLVVDVGKLRSLHPQVQGEPTGASRSTRSRP